MVKTHWETSKKPLFIKTVWQDGHHHVVLQNEETNLKLVRSARKSPRRQNSTPPIPEQPQISFKVPSKKLFLVGLRSDSTYKGKQRPKTDFFPKQPLTIEITPMSRLRFSNINNQVSFNNIRNPFTKSISAEVKNWYNNGDTKTVATPPPPFSYDNYWMDQFNNLSERVLIWLDLAVEKDHFYQPKIHLQKQQFFRGKTEQSFRDKIEEKVLKPIVVSEMEVEETLQEKPIIKPLTIRERTGKRQLHIFIPNLPGKKIGSTNSFLSSSKNSSVFLA